MVRTSAKQRSTRTVPCCNDFLKLELIQQAGAAASSTERMETKVVEQVLQKKKSSSSKKPAKKTTKKKNSKRVAKAATKDTKKARSRGTASKQVSKTKSLVIVESPAKARTLTKYLGSGFSVKASVGHLKDLPKSKLSVDVDNDFEPNYEIIRGKNKVLKEIKSEARKAKSVFLAPDPDREGEAIAWHIAEELRAKHTCEIHRIRINEITKRAVLEAIAHPEQLDQNKFASQQARRILDRLVGYEISPILWDKVRRGLSAGRVQSVAVRLIVEREREIAAFVPEEYWVMECHLAGEKPPPFWAKVVKQEGKPFRPGNRTEATNAKAQLEQAAFKVQSITKRERRRRPSPPLITSKLQQEAANRLHFTAYRTMRIAQQLYEGVELGGDGSVGLITYMRTDSTRVSPDALGAVRGHIQQKFGPDYLPKEPIVYKSKKGAQDAHEAIRPTSMDYPPDQIASFLTHEQLKLYRLIWNAFVGSQMNPAVYDQTTVDIAAAVFLLRATGSSLKFPGFLAAYGVAGENEESRSQEEASTSEDVGTKTTEALLPVLSEGEALQCKEIKPEQKFTQPPPRFSEASLVKELEEVGIGRPSTYATILSTIVARQYVLKDQNRFSPTELGVLVTDLLVEAFPKVMDVEFTAHMEEQLDDVEDGKVEWRRLLKDFYHGGFKEQLALAKDNMRDVKREEIPTEHVCEECNNPMVIKWGRHGSFLACTGYPECRNTKEIVRHADGTIEIQPEITTDERCPKCDGPMVVKRGKYGQFLACQAYPECKGTRPMSIGMRCPEDGCDGYVAERRSRRGRVFYGCSNYPNCTFASWGKPMEGKCPLCGNNYLVNAYSKKHGLRIKCPKKECGYIRESENPDQQEDMPAAMQ